jgi:hypothetical protein
MFWPTFATIAQDVGLHMGWKQLYVLPSNTFNYSCWWINIVLTKNGIRTLVDVVITNLTRADLLPRSCTTQRFVTSNVAQAKKRSYCDRHLADQFLPLTVELFGCVFTQLCQCHLEFERTKRPSSFYLDYFSLTKKFNHIAKAASILHLKLGGSHRPSYSWLPPLQDTSPISMTDLLQVASFLYGKIRSTY